MSAIEMVLNTMMFELILIFKMCIARTTIIVLRALKVVVFQGIRSEEVFLAEAAIEWMV